MRVVEPYRGKGPIVTMVRKVRTMREVRFEAVLRVAPFGRVVKNRLIMTIREHLRVLRLMQLLPYRDVFIIIIEIKLITLLFFSKAQKLKIRKKRITELVKTTGKTGRTGIIGTRELARIMLKIGSKTPPPSKPAKLLQSSQTVPTTPNRKNQYNLKNQNNLKNHKNQKNRLIGITSIIPPRVGEVRL